MRGKTNASSKVHKKKKYRAQSIKKNTFKNKLNKNKKER